jgi:hypothetical protein
MKYYKKKRTRIAPFVIGILLGYKIYLSKNDVHIIKNQKLKKVNYILKKSNIVYGIVRKIIYIHFLDSIYFIMDFIIDYYIYHAIW